VIFFKKFDFAIVKIKIEIYFYGNVLEKKANIVWVLWYDYLFCGCQIFAPCFYTCHMHNIQ